MKYLQDSIVNNPDKQTLQHRIETKSMRSILFPIILLTITFLLEWYTYNGVKAVTKEKKKWMRKLVNGVFFALLGASIIGWIVLFFFGGSLPFWLVNFFFGFVAFNLIVKFIFSLFLGLDDFIRLIRWVAKKFEKKKSVETNEENGISRSEFLLQSGLIAASVPVISLSAGMVVGPYRYTYHYPSVSLKNLPPAFNGLKIAQISDIHSGSFYNKEAVNRGIDMILDQNPDVIFFTGDLVNNISEEMTDYMDLFSRLKAPLGVYSILGNHDYGDYHNWENDEEKSANLDRLKVIHGELGWRLLLDEHVYLERGKEKIGLIGVENWGSGFHQIGDLAKAYQGCEAPVKLLLSHDPTHWDEEVRKLYTDIDITFSGHTHGAQMGIETGGFKWSPVSLRYDKWAGLYQEDHQFLYVNRGFGFLGYPGRIGIWPEITIMTLLKA